MGHAKFEILKGTNDDYYFHLKAGNGEVILSSQGYSTKANCQKGIHSVEANSMKDEHFEKKLAKNGNHYFVLKATNGQTIGKSQMYKSESGCSTGIKSVHENASKAEIVDLTLA